MSEVLASDIARLLKAVLNGPDLRVTGVSSLSRPRAHTLGFRTGAWDEASLPRPILVLASTAPELAAEGVTVIQTAYPRQAYAYVVEHVFARSAPGIAASALIGADVDLGENVHIGEGVTIEDGVHIGAETHLEPGVLIGRGTWIGARCRIGARAVIGNEGLGSFEADDGRLRNVRHLGRVRIGDDVEIGALSAVARGTIDNTEIGANTHIGPMVNIGHNSVIGKRCQIAGRAHLSGSVVIDDGAKLWANCTLKEGVRIGAGAVIGMGANVDRDVVAGQTVVALPATGLKQLAEFVRSFKWRR